jgi:1-deoxy-D-xylulose-5-phosphate synthase
LGFPDSFIEQGEQAELKAAYGLDAAGIARSVRQALGEKRCPVISFLPAP